MIPTSITDPAPVLPDLLASGLDVVFCGTAPGHISAARRAYYAHPQNKFWRILYEAGFTPELLAPADYARLITFGIGLTDIAKFDHGMDYELARGALGAAAIDDLRARIARYRPRILAFTSKTGGTAFLKGSRPYGVQPETLGETRIWVLPSPSPAAIRFWDAGPWRDLGRMIKKRSG
ncbi:MAG: mismatch-specific DNA-glycosylase [Rhodospirillales bacterium]|nr:mismatch-specific DNA-glycosylase [Alphaproteobacteria bacterium]MCB9986161.1 mismatch-specific DNA-glycosylase [Rhodospirillales bacterium]USO07281.1 MAG: mismatch-specific DNA-glycosylase [Rhodospirillales bacterium]